MSAADEVVDWQAYANCADVDPDLFFPERGSNLHLAKAVCAGCVVRDECREYAITHVETYGVWGGLSPRELEKERGERRRADGKRTTGGRRLQHEAGFRVVR